MTALALANPQHAEALRWVLAIAGLCDFPVERPCGLTGDALANFLAARNEARTAAMLAVGDAARRTPPDPALAAELVRGLLERAGWNVASAGPWTGAPDMPYVEIHDAETDAAGGSHPLFVAWALNLTPRLVSALLNATSADEAMAAVREVGR